MDVYSKFQDVFLKYVNLDIMALGRMELYALLNRDAHTLSSQVISQRVCEVTNLYRSFELPKVVTYCILKLLYFSGEQGIGQLAFPCFIVPTG
jgi:hypothetical protein